MSVFHPFRRARAASLAAFLAALSLVAVLLFALSCARRASAQANPAAPPAPAAATAPNTAPLDVRGTVDIHHREQKLLGFGIALAFFQDWVAKNPYRAEIYRALFKDLNLNILRLRDCYSDKSDNLAHIAQDAVNVKGASDALGRPVQVMLCSWSPPATLKSNHETANGGTLIQVDGHFAYDQFAQYWADSLAAYKADGVVPTYVSVQNEPDFKATWDSCLFTPKEGQTSNGIVCAGYGNAVDAVYKKLGASPNPPKLIGPETIGIGYGDPENYFPPADPKLNSELWGLSHHLYHGGTEKDPDSFDPRFRDLRREYADKPKLMSEFDRGTMFQTAWLINDCLTEENANAYVYWSGAWPGSQALVFVENPDQQAYWTNPHGWKLGDHYWAMKHFSAFTGPGYVRVDTTTSDPAVKMSAFISPNGRKLCVVVLNTSPTQQAIFHLNLSGFRARRSVMYRTDKTEHWAGLGALPADRRLDLPPQSIVTVALD